MILGAAALLLGPIAYRQERQFRSHSSAAQGIVENVREIQKNGSTTNRATVSFDAHGERRTAEVETDRPAQLGGIVAIRYRGGDVRSVESLSSPFTVFKAFVISGALLFVAGGYGYFRSRRWLRPRPTGTPLG